MLTTINALLQILSILANPQPEFSGSLSRYDPGVMGRVLEWRHETGYPAGFDPYQDYDGYIAVMWCEWVGHAADLDLYVDGEFVGTKHVLISDCANPQHLHTLHWMATAGIAAEVDYAAWQAWGLEDGVGAWIDVRVTE